VNLSGLEDALFSYELFDLSGRKVLEKQNTQNPQINMANLMSGVYILNIKQKNKSVSFKIVKTD
jgi:hypothetical protein